MTSEQYILHMEKYKDFLKNGLMKSVIVPEGNQLLAETKNRVVVDGKSSTGNKIGNYSKKPGYYGREQFTNKGSYKGIGKNGGTPRSSMYLPQGYFQFRGIQGRENTFVNMNLSGDTQNRYQMRVNGNKLIFGMTTKRAANIREGNDKRFGVNIFASTKQQLEDFNKRVALGMDEGYNQTMNE